ncbi:MAG: Ig-like domain-containing protein, partial [Paludibacter sp.]|nr:Ig-like domain-containing protein [Paludibacter sp.]
EVILTDPLDGAINVITNKQITATFNEAMVASTINETTFILKKGGNLVLGNVSYAGMTATFSPTNVLDANTVYTATMKRNVKDPMGNIMIKDTTWSFNTGAIPTVVLTNPVDGASDVALNQVITADFSTAMSAASIDGGTFIVKQGANVVAGTVSYAGMKATFAPTANLLQNKVYTATITTDATDVAGNALAKDTTWSFATGILPIITVTDPLNNAVNVAINRKVTATFSKAMSVTSINPSTFTLKQETDIVLGLVSYDDMTATFTPSANLSPGVEYTATITTGVKDLNNHSIEKDSTWKFTTSVLIIPVLPYVVSTDPNDQDIDVALDKAVTATFSKTMDPNTINSSTFKLMNGLNPVLGFVTYAGLVGTFTPANPLLAGIVYDATVTTGVKDVDGNAMASDKTWSFTTIAPIVQYTVSLSSLPVDAGTTIGAGLFNAGSSVTVEATPEPGFSFEKWTELGVEVSTSAIYTFGINSNRDLVANFAIIISGPPGVDLGSAGDFAIMAGSGISNTGVSTIITGDVGSFPTATIVGLLPANVIGTLYTVADPVVGAAQLALTNAYNDAQGRSLDAIDLPGQLGGLVLAPGLYVNSSTSGISGTGANGILTLDAGGNPNSVWIFKMGSTFITDAGTSVVLAGGAKASNIYWSVGTSATLGTNSIFYGNILADQSITLTTGATLTGRALTRIGAVTLDSNTVTKP